MTIAPKTKPDPKLAWLIEVTEIVLDEPGDQGGKPGGASPSELAEKLRRQMEKEDQEEEIQKQFAIGDAMRLVKPLKPALKAGFDFQIIDRKGEARDVQAKTGDLSEVGDVDDLHGGGGVVKGTVDAGKIVGDATKAQQMLMTIQKQLERITTTRTVKLNSQGDFVAGQPEKLFTADEIAEELFTPLVREKIIGSTLVENKYSQVQKMLDGSNALYKEELKTPTIDENSRVGNILKAAVNAGSSMVSAVLSVNGLDTKMVNDLLEGSTELANLTIDFGDKARAGIDVQNVTDFLNGLPSIVGGMVGTALGDSTLGDTITVSAGTATAAVKLIGLSIQNKTLDAGALVAFGQSLISVGLTIKGDQSDNDKESAKYSLALQFTDALGDAMAAKANDVIAAVRAGDIKAVRGAVLGAVKDFVMNGVPKIAAGVVNLEDASSDSSSDGKKTTKEENDIERGTSTLNEDDQAQVLQGFEDNLKEDDKQESITTGGESLAEALDTGLEYRDGQEDAQNEEDNERRSEARSDRKQESRETGKKTLATLKSDIKTREGQKAKGTFDPAEWEKKLQQLETEVDDKALRREQLAEQPEEFAQSVRAELDREKEEFKKELEGLRDPAKVKSIQALMAKIQKDRAMMAVAVAIGKGGFSVAAKFLAPMKIGTEAIKLALNIKAVVERAVALRAFVDEAAGATNAVSPYLSSIQNFVDNQSNQLDQYSIRIAFNAANIIAAAAATAFPLAAPAVAIVDAGASAAELIFTVANEKRLREAWALTKEALGNPGNRRLGLRVRKFNPTLAKYTIAYGAKIAGDPIAVSMCNACGIDNDSLKKENEGAAKVKAFLELKFNEDGKLAIKYEDPPTWIDDLPDPQLTPGCVFHTYKIIAEGLATNPSASKVGGISPQPRELATLLKVAAAEVPDTVTGDEMRAHVLLVERVTNAFKAESDRLSPLGPEAAHAVGTFSDLSETLENKLVMRLLKKMQEEAKTGP